MDYVAAAFAHTTKIGLLQARLEHALQDPRTFEAAQLARTAGLDLIPGWLSTDRRSIPLVPTLRLS